jgi:hypothetical protein
MKKKKLFLHSYKRVGQETQMAYVGGAGVDVITLVIFSTPDGLVSMVAVRGSQIVYEAFRVDEDKLIHALKFLSAKICRKEN